MVIYGVNGSFSKQLRETANSFYTLPTEQDLNGSYYKTVFDYLKTSQRPRLDEAIEVAAKKHRGVPKQKIAAAVKKLMENDVISERAIANSKGKKQKMLFVDWEKAEKYMSIG